MPDRSEIAQTMRDRECNGTGFVDFQQDTVDWDGIVAAIAAHRAILDWAVEQQVPNSTIGDDFWYPVTQLAQIYGLERVAEVESAELRQADSTS